MLGVDRPVHTAVQPVLEEWRGNGAGRLRSQVCHQLQLGQSLARFGNRSVLPLPLESEEGEQLVFLDRSADRTAKPLPGVGRIGWGTGSIPVRDLLVRVERLLTEECEGR